MLKFAFGLFFGKTFADLLDVIIECIKSAISVSTMKFNVKIDKLTREIEKEDSSSRAIGFATNFEEDEEE